MSEILHFVGGLEKWDGLHHLQPPFSHLFFAAVSFSFMSLCGAGWGVWPVENERLFCGILFLLG
jgi:predicted Na+-dependent transporter